MYTQKSLDNTNRSSKTSKTSKKITMMKMNERYKRQRRRLTMTAVVLRISEELHHDTNQQTSQSTSIVLYKNFQLPFFHTLILSVVLFCISFSSLYRILPLGTESLYQLRTISYCHPVTRTSGIPPIGF